MKDEDPLWRAANALYETDEDMIDEAIIETISLKHALWREVENPRKPFGEMTVSIQQAYLRRARAVLASLAYVPDKQLLSDVIEMGTQHYMIMRLSRESSR